MGNRLMVLLSLSWLWIVACADKDCLQLANKLNDENQKLLKEINSYSESFISLLDELERINNKYNEANVALGLFDYETRLKGSRRTQNRERAKQHLKSINEMLAQSKKRIEDLELQIKGLTSNKEFALQSFSSLREALLEKEQKIQQMVETFERLQQREKELVQENVQLKTEREDLLETKVFLATQNVVKDSIIAELQEEIITGFYICDTEDNLKEKGIIAKSGALFWKKTEILNLSQREFTPVNTKKQTVIQFNGAKGVKILSEHKSSLGRLCVLRTNSLEILDPVGFWKISSYLIFARD